MNLKKLFVVGSVLVMAWTTANAELVNGVRQRPNVAVAEDFQVDVTYYLFNTKARLFFAGANDWNTRASVADFGYKVKFVADPLETFPGALEFTDSVETQKAWKSTFSTDDGLAIWVDNATATYRFWEVVKQPDGAYRISNNHLVSESADGKANAEGKFLGWNGSDDTRLYFVDPAAEGAGADWVFVTEETYNTWKTDWDAVKDAYNQAAELLTYIKSAKEKNIDVAAEVAVYENEAATVDELKAAITSVQTKINEALGGNASVEKPSDMTGVLVNPAFDDGTATGWKGTAPNMKGDGKHAAANVAEHYDKTFDTYQEISNMPTGVYTLEANAFFRGSWEDHANHANYVAKLYAHADGDTLTTEIHNPWDALRTEPIAGDASTTYFETPNAEEKGEHDGATYYIPSNPSTARLYFEDGYYQNKLFFAVEEGTVRLGISKDQKITGSDWVVFDNFKLSYYGKSAEAYQYWISQSPKIDYTGTVASEQYLNAYNAAFSATATNKAEAVAAMKAITAASDSIAKNAQLWADLQTKYDDGHGVSVEYDLYDAAYNLGDYLDEGTDEDGNPLIPMSVKAFLNAKTKTGECDLTNKQLEDIIATINTLIDAVYTEVKEGLKPGTDVTKFLTNPGFEDGSKGWTVVSKGGGNVNLGGNDANHCYEAWHSTNFDVYQEVSNLPVGLYKLEVNGYVRYLDGGEDKKNNPAINNREQSYELFEAGVPIYLYMNDSKTGLVNWFSYPKPKAFYDAIEKATYLYENDENAYPDNMIAASAAFADGGYLQETICMVSEPNTVTRIGVKGTPEAKFWPIFDNFKLTYLGNGVDIVKPQLEEKIAEAKKYENVVTTKTAKANLAAEVSAAETLLAGTDGDAMLAAIDKLQKAIDDVNEGKTTCKEFNDFIEDFMQFAQNLENNGVDVTAALQLGATILENLNVCAYDAEDIEAKKLELREMRLKIQLPADYAQGSAQGTDLTAFIQTPDFSKIKDGVETNSNDGWLGTAGSFGPDDQKSNLCLEFYNKEFDMYQDLAGVGSVVLPHGYYALQVSAFNRPAESNPAYLYAVAGNDTLDVKTIMLQADGINTELGESAPNSVSSAKEYFNEGRYVNTLKFLFEGDTLRIGVKHPVNVDRDWVIMDDFKLFFYGNDNTGVETVINIGKPAKVQYFTLDGRQVSVARKGLFIRKTTMDNGTVVVRKIQK